MRGCAEAPDVFVSQRYIRYTDSRQRCLSRDGWFVQASDYYKTTIYCIIIITCVNDLGIMFILIKLYVKRHPCIFVINCAPLDREFILKGKILLSIGPCDIKTYSQNPKIVQL